MEINTLLVKPSYYNAIFAVPSVQLEQYVEIKLSSLGSTPKYWERMSFHIGPCTVVNIHAFH